MKTVRYALLEAIGKQWVVGVDMWAMAFFGVCVVANFAVGYFRPDLFGIVVLVGLPVAFAISFFGDEVFYRGVRCPACKERLNYFKNGKRVPSKQAFAQLREGGRCRHCGWEPTATSLLRFN